MINPKELSGDLSVSASRDELYLDMSGDLCRSIPDKPDEPDKLRYDLIPAEPIKQLATLLTKGHKHYGESFWKTLPIKDHNEALWRHFMEFQLGELKDGESGQSPLVHMVCRALFILELQRECQERVNRWENRK